MLWGSTSRVENVELAYTFFRIVNISDNVYIPIVKWVIDTIDTVTKFDE